MPVTGGGNLIAHFNPSVESSGFNRISVPSWIQNMAGAWFMRPCHHWAFVFFLAVLFGFDPVLGDKHDDEKRLKDTIMREYKKDALPDNTALTGLGFVNVSIYITPLYIDVVSIFQH